MNEEEKSKQLVSGRIMDQGPPKLKHLQIESQKTQSSSNEQITESMREGTQSNNSQNKNAS